MAIVILICGWLFKAACIQQGPNGAGGVTLDQGGQRPWITACYNDAVPLYGSHELDTATLPYATSWQDNGETRYMEYPVVTGYWMWADRPALPRLHRVGRGDRASCRCRWMSPPTSPSARSSSA